jgi:DNA repair exonuclease SbcCD ATPase subunit
MIHQHTTGLDRTTNGGNTGKVITTLQSDLLYARTALDQSKSQLRLSQRAVESLNRQTEDLKESMSRLRLENEGLSKMLSRKERTVSELMDRLKRSEAELSTLKQEKKELDVNYKKISKETDEIVKDSVRRRDRAETQYEAVRSGVKSLSEGWKRDVTTLKQDISRLEEKHRKEMDDSRLKYNTRQFLLFLKFLIRICALSCPHFFADLNIIVAKLHASRSGALSRIETDLNSLQSSKEGFIAKYTSELSVLKAHLEEEEKKSCEGLQLAKEVSDECARFKRLLRTHSDSPSSRSPNGMPR